MTVNNFFFKMFNILGAAGKIRLVQIMEDVDIEKLGIIFEFDFSRLSLQKFVNFSEFVSVR